MIPPWSPMLSTMSSVSPRVLSMTPTTVASRRGMPANIYGKPSDHEEHRQEQVAGLLQRPVQLRVRSAVHGARHDQASQERAEDDVQAERGRGPGRRYRHRYDHWDFVPDQRAAPT